MPIDLEKLFHERDTINEQAIAAQKLLDDYRTRDFLLDILCLNAATIVALNQCSEFSQSLLEKIAQQLLEELYRVLPQLKGKIDYYELSNIY